MASCSRNVISATRIGQPTRCNEYTEIIGVSEMFTSFFKSFPILVAEERVE